MFGNIFGKVFSKRPDVPSHSVIGANSALMKKHWPIHARDRNALSHLGGDPLLPSAADWPRCVFEGEQQPIHFLAQIDCSSLPQFDGRSLLPQTGLLSFFLLIHEELGGEDENTCAVRYFPMSQRLERYIPPENLMPNYAARTYDQGFMDFLSPAKSNLAVRRFGFVPITLEPFKTQIHPEASPMAPWGPAPEPTKENLQAYYAEREAAMDSILGKEPEDDNPARYILESSWPQTVYAARQALQQIAASLQIKYAETFSMVHPPADDQRKFEPKLSTISADWLDKMKPVQLALNQLEGRPILDDAGDEIRQIVNDAVDEMGGLNYYQTIGAEITLLRQFNVEDVPCSPTILEKARSLCLGANFNGNQIMGFQQEVQGGSNETALKKAQRLGWADIEATPIDMQLLAQFDTCYGGWGTMFADCGKAYFYIQKSDLIQGHFDRVVAVVDGG